MKKKKFYYPLIAGSIEAMVMQPFDTIKVLKQSNSYKGLNFYTKSSGIKYLYKGLTPFIFQMNVKYALRFTTFELFRGNDNKIYKNFLAGITAGFVESCFITPFELVKTNLQTTKNKNPIDVTKKLTQEKGLKKLYRGFYATCFRQSINQATNFTIYHEIRKKILNNDTNPAIYKFMFAGALSGSIGPILNNPFDVVKTRYMNPNYNYNSIFSAGKDIIKKEGVSKLYSGLGLRIFRVAGGQAITFSVIEFLIKYL